MSDNTKFGPPKGMRDWLPQETLLRQKLIRLIESHYQLYGFQPIDTPVMENIEVLQGKGGGENEKLMFKVEKRGDDYANAVKEIAKHQAFRKNVPDFKEEDDKDEESLGEWEKRLKNLSNMGLRFDLTVPLARYYANHSNDLPKPFRCYHIGPVWRADRPQKGRYREFYQCDIDIVGGTSDSYEVELLLATDRVLKELNIGKFKIRISHKDFLPAFLKEIGMLVELQIQEVTKVIDKMDKQSQEEILKEIERFKFPEKLQKNIFNFIEISKDFKKESLAGIIKETVEDLADFFKRKGFSELGKIVAQTLFDSISSVQKRVLAINPNANVVFDPWLVRGFDYYTGLVFEINVENKDFNFSVGGGGRYDGLIEKLGGPKGTPAVGISLGFERIMLLLAEKEKSASQTIYPRVFIANNGESEKDILALAEQLRSDGIQVEACMEKKDFKKQMETAQANGIDYAITDFKPGSKSCKVRQLSTRQDKEMPLADLYDIMKRLAEGVED